MSPFFQRKQKQTGCTEKHSVRAGYSSNCIKSVVCGNAFCTEFLPDPVSADSDSLSYHVSPADVLRSNRTSFIR